MDIKEYFEKIKYEQQTIFVHLRLHLDEPTKETLGVYFKDFNIVLIAEEQGIRKHFHVMLGDDDEKKFGKNLKILRERLKKDFNLKSNKEYSLALVRNLMMIQSYLCKDNCFVYSGIPIEVIETVKKVSYKKYKKCEFKLALESTRVLFLSDKKFGGEELITSLVDLKLQYNQVLNMPQLENICTTWLCQKDASYKYKLIKNSWRNVKNKFYDFDEN